jgi:hypothetical protein
MESREKLACFSSVAASNAFFFYDYFHHKSHEMKETARKSAIFGLQGQIKGAKIISTGAQKELTSGAAATSSGEAGNPEPITTASICSNATFQIKLF